MTAKSTDSFDADIRYTVFDTAIGACGIAWRVDAPSTVAAFQLPEATAEATEARMLGWLKAERSDPPEPIAGVIDRVCRHLEGTLDDFLNIPLDYAGVGDFERRVHGRGVSLAQEKALAARARSHHLPIVLARK